MGAENSVSQLSLPASFCPSLHLPHTYIPFHLLSEARRGREAGPSFTLEGEEGSFYWVMEESGTAEDAGSTLMSRETNKRPERAW